jgi:hypothetical protein
LQPQNIESNIGHGNNMCSLKIFTILSLSSYHLSFCLSLSLSVRHQTQDPTYARQVFYTEIYPRSCGSLLILRTILQSRYYYYFHFADGKNKAYSSEITYIRTHKTVKRETCALGMVKLVQSPHCLPDLISVHYKVSLRSVSLFEF